MCTDGAMKLRQTPQKSSREGINGAGAGGETREDRAFTSTSTSTSISTSTSTSTIIRAAATATATATNTSTSGRETRANHDFDVRDYPLKSRNNIYYTLIYFLNFVAFNFSKSFIDKINKILVLEN
jgi:hypothetical protein